MAAIIEEARTINAAVSAAAGHVSGVPLELLDLLVAGDPAKAIGAARETVGRTLQELELAQAALHRLIVASAARAVSLNGERQ